MTNTSLITLAFVVNIAVQIQLRSSIDNSSTNLKVFFYLIGSTILAGIFIKALEFVEERLILRLKKTIAYYESMESSFKELKERYYRKIQQLKERVASAIPQKYDIKSLSELSEAMDIASQYVNQVDLSVKEIESSLISQKNDIVQAEDLDMKILLLLAKEENLDFVWMIFLTTQMLLFLLSILEAIRYFWAFLLGVDSLKAIFDVYTGLLWISFLFTATIIIVAFNPTSPITWNIGKSIVAFTKVIIAKILEACRTNMGI
ncbi:hypothetical protein [Leptolyngbya iicbica]|uniref:Uncharacterized protein n=2 Tax=Cyanophyceae TaxID=3028117 RepID=A0A4Q7E5B3_9CYAN|nr:hypothetical protein [Leptolyngbya sp. LK]RZM77239.1 hypothetical protein DYY88_16460 [Leptolyngbya sp. LK]